MDTCVCLHMSDAISALWALCSNRMANLRNVMLLKPQPLTPDLPMYLQCAWLWSELTFSLWNPETEKANNSRPWRFFNWSLLFSSSRTIRQWGEIWELYSHTFFLVFQQKCFYIFCSKGFLLNISFTPPDAEFMSCEAFCVWMTWMECRALFSDWLGILCLLSFLTWVFKRTAGRAEGCKAASIWSRQVCDSMSSGAAYLQSLGVEL